MWKRSFTKILAIAVLAFIAAAPVSASAAPAAETSISGTLQVTAVGPNGPEQAVYSGTGKSRPFGPTTMQGVISIVGPATGCSGFAATHEDTLTASNGDQVSVHIVEESCTTDGSNFTCGGVFTITGGTGRFANVTGSGTWDGSLTLNTATGAGTFSTTYTWPSGM